MGIWSYVAATFALASVVSGVFVAGVTYGDMRTKAVYDKQAIDQRDQVIAEQAKQLEAKDGSVEKAQADMAKVQDDLAAIRRASTSVGTQLRSALDASQMGTCLLEPAVRELRGNSADATDAAVDAANRARDPG